MGVVAGERDGNVWEITGAELERRVYGAVDGKWGRESAGVGNRMEVAHGVGATRDCG